MTTILDDRLVSLLACPDCRGLVTLAPHALTCTSCTRTFEVRDGIPRMLPADVAVDEARTGSHFAKEFTVHAGHDQASDQIDEFYLASRTGFDATLLADRIDPYAVDENVPSVDLTSLDGRVVLDAGTGPGRFTRVAARHADFVVGLDLGEHITQASNRCSDLDNVAFVQGSVLAPPFKDGVFVVAFSIGVLHHTPDPRRGAHRLTQTLRLGGRLAVWVYPPSYWGGRVRGPFVRAMHRLLNQLPVEVAWWVCSKMLYRLGLLQEAIARQPWRKRALAPLFLLPVPRHPNRAIMRLTIYDYYAPPIISVHTPREVVEWLEGAGLHDITIGPVDSAAHGTRA